MAFDKYSELDPAKLQRDIEEQHGNAFFDKYAILDDAHRAQQIETTMGIELSNDAMSNPMLLMQEMVIAGGGSAPTWLAEYAAPNNDLPLFVFDPMQGRYYAGEELMVSDVVSDPSKINGSGLVIAVGDTAQIFLGAMAAAMTISNGTIATKVMIAAPAGEFSSGALVATANNDDDSNELWTLYINGGGVHDFEVDYYDANTGGGPRSGANATYDVESGISWTYSPAGITMSQNGGVIQSDTTACSPIATRVVIGGYNPETIIDATKAFTLIRMIGYPMQPNADLPALSEVS